MVRRWKDQPAFRAILNELQSENNDRAVGIVAVATLEYALVLAIEAHCSPISRRVRKKVLESESIKKMIDFAAEKGVIDQQAADDLHTLRHIRNEFAHDMNPLSFTSENILPLCEKLPVPNILDDAEPVEPEDINERLRRRFIEMTYLQLLLLIGDLEG